MNHRYSYCKREAEEREAAEREAREKGGGGGMVVGGVETTELLMRRAYLQGLGTLGYSDLEEQQEDGGCDLILRNGSEGRGGGEQREVDRKTYGQQEASFREREEEEEESDSRSQMHSTKDEDRKDETQLMDESSREGKTDKQTEQND